MPLTPLLHITAAYSNAVLLAVLPHVSDTARILNLPVQQPISIEQVDHFNTSRNPDNIGGGLWLTNGYWFAFSNGRVDSFRSPNDWYSNPYFEGVDSITGNDNMTTNDAIALAQTSFSNLGFNPKTFLVNKSPTTFDSPSENKQFPHIPFCRVNWENLNTDTPENRNKSYSVKFDVDMQHKQIVGMVLLFGSNYWRANPEIEIKPEFERDYRKRIQRTNTDIPSN